MTPPVAILLTLTLTCAASVGHGLLDEQIAEVSKQLAASPRDAQLLLRRAELHRGHQDFGSAGADLRSIPPEDPGHRAALLQLSRLLREQKRSAEAAKTLARYFSLEGAAPEAFRESALVHASLGQSTEAAKAWAGYLRRAKTPTADEFVAAAQAHLAMDDGSASLAVVTRGLERYPRSIPLHQFAAARKLAMGGSAAAIVHFETLRTAYPTLLPRLFYEEGSIWDQQGAPDQARAAYRQALHHLKQLPKNKRSQPGLHTLRQTLELLVSP